MKIPLFQIFLLSFYQFYVFRSNEVTVHFSGKRETLWRMQIRNGLLDYISHFKIVDTCTWLWTICQVRNVYIVWRQSLILVLITKTSTYIS